MSYDSGSGLPWWRFHVHLRMCVLLFWGGVFYKCPLEPVVYRLFLFCFFSFLYYRKNLLFFCLLLLITERGMSKSPTIIVDLSISHLSSVVFTSYVFKVFYLVHIHLGLCVFLKNWSFYRYVLFFFIPGNFFALKAALSDITLATPAFFWLLIYIFRLLLLAYSGHYTWNEFPVNRI